MLGFFIKRVMWEQQQKDQEGKCLAFNMHFTKLTLITGEAYYIVLLLSYELLIDLSSTQWSIPRDSSDSRDKTKFTSLKKTPNKTVHELYLCSCILRFLTLRSYYTNIVLPEIYFLYLSIFVH